VGAALGSLEGAVPSAGRRFASIPRVSAPSLDRETDSEPSAGRAVAAQRVEEVVIRFAGDSGDGMQLTGTQFTNTSARVGNDLATFPDFPPRSAPRPARCRRLGVPGRIADYDIHTPGDAPDVLVAMNPAALKVNLPTSQPNGALIVNVDEFEERNLKKAGYATNPLDRRHSLAGWRVFPVQLATLTKRALEGSGLDAKSRSAARTSSPSA
jgi:2-oxoglutarate/2-oxoacid ferredoxin oxidoreductase subunit alpha